MMHTVLLFSPLILVTVFAIIAGLFIFKDAKHKRSYSSRHHPRKIKP